MCSEREYGVGGMMCFFFFQDEDGIRGLGRSRGVGDVYKGQPVRPIRVASQPP